MTTRMSELNPILAAVPLWAFQDNGRFCLIDGEKNLTGHDIMLLFSSEENARRYAVKYPSLVSAEPKQVTIAGLVGFFHGRVDHYILDRP